MTTEERLQSVENAVAGLQVAITNLASSKQVSQLGLLRQADITDLQTRVTQLETTVTQLEATVQTILDSL